MLELWRSLTLRIRALFGRRHLHRDLQDELAYHLELRQGKGQIPFGNATLIREEMRDLWTFRWIEVSLQDLHYAVRTLRKQPGFSLIVILTLAFGIGSTTAIFSVFDAAVLQSLPYPDARRLVELIGDVKRQTVERRGTSLADYADWRDQNRSFENMALFTDGTVTLTGGHDPEQVQAEVVAQPYFTILGIQAVIGRTFRPEEDQVPQRDAVVLLSNGLWKRRFGGDPGIIGRSLRLDDFNYRVIGVLPDWFHGLTDTAELWIPLNMSATPEAWTQRGTRGPSVLAKLKPGVSLVAAQTEMIRLPSRTEACHLMSAFHSWRRATMGPTLVARRAGM
jgi:hypothetical protein